MQILELQGDVLRVNQGEFLIQDITEIVVMKELAGFSISNAFSRIPKENGRVIFYTKNKKQFFVQYNLENNSFSSPNYMLEADLVDKLSQLFSLLVHNEQQLHNLSGWIQALKKPSVREMVVLYNLSTCINEMTGVCLCFEGMGIHGHYTAVFTGNKLSIVEDSEAMLGIKFVMKVKEYDIKSVEIVRGASEDSPTGKAVVIRTKPNSAIWFVLEEEVDWNKIISLQNGNYWNKYGSEDKMTNRKTKSQKQNKSNNKPKAQSVNQVDVQAQNQVQEKKQTLPDKDMSKTQDENQTIELLKQYKELMDAGILTQEEFETKKKQLLGL